MRLFHIKLADIGDYSWARNNEEYKVSYAKQIAESDAELAAREESLAKIGITYVDKVPVIVTATQLIELSLAKVGFEVIRELIAGREDPVDQRDFLAEFTAIANKLLAAPALKEHQDFEGDHTAFNNRVNIHMPGQALSTYNELMLAEDSCTDALQKSLDDGWRIIAALPQPDARRPDYVLGRYNSEREIGHSQARRQ